MGNETIRTAVGLRLGATLCVLHDRPHCGMQVDHSGVHGLSCRSSQGRLPRYTALNDIIEPFLLLICHPHWNHVVYVGWMVRDLMASPSYPGLKAVPLFGMCRVGTAPSPHPTFRCHHPGLGCWPIIR